MNDMKLAVVLRVVLEAFVIATVSFPAAILNKALFVVLVGLTAIFGWLRPRRLPVETRAPLVVAAIFLYGAALGFGGDVDRDLARQLLFGVALLFLVYPARWVEADLDGIMRRAGHWLTVFSFVYWGALSLSPFSRVALELFRWMTDASLGAVGSRDFLGFPVFMVHLGTSPFLLISFALVLLHDRGTGRRGSLAALAMFVAIVMSTSRALILLSVALAVVLLLEHRPPRLRVILGLGVIAVGAGGLAWLAASTTVFSPTDMSNAIKLGHAESFLTTRTWQGLLFGDGLAAMHFTAGLGLRVPQTEITLLDMLRYFGIVLAPLVFSALLFPVADSRRYVASPTGRLAVLVFAAYLTLAMTNPVLFNSAGLTVVLWYWSRILPRPADTPIPGTFA